MLFFGRRTLFCLLLHFPLFAQTSITGVSFSGLGRTNPDYLCEQITSRAGQIFSDAQVGSDRRQLLNLQLFISVNAITIDSLGGKWITFDCREVIRRLPIVNFGGVRDNFWFQLGGMDHNFLGRNGILSGSYRYYDRHSVEANMELPFPHRPGWNIRAYAAILSTLEPAYFPQGASVYEVRHRIAMGGLSRQIGRVNRLVFDLGYLEERYLREDSAPRLGPAHSDFKKLILRLGFLRDAINYLYMQQSGYAFQIFVEPVKTLEESPYFWKWLNVLRVFAAIGSEGTFAGRARLGLARNEQSPFVPFVVDSYITVRGSGNRVARGTAEVTANLEYRHNIIKRGGWGVQAVGFVDASAWRPPGELLENIFARDNLVTFAGGGIRFHWFRLNHFVLRADYGVSLYNGRQRGFVVGYGHYF